MITPRLITRWLDHPIDHIIEASWKDLASGDSRFSYAACLRRRLEHPTHLGDRIIAAGGTWEINVNEHEDVMIVCLPVGCDALMAEVVQAFPSRKAP